MLPSIAPTSRFPYLLSHESLDDGDIAVVISQDCDILHSNYSLEPYVEIHLLRRILALDGNYVHAKNPRILHLKCSCLSEKHLYEVRHSQKNLIPREYLVGKHPVHPCTIGGDPVRELATWTGRKYFRSSFPTSFVERTQSVLKELGSIMKFEGGLITGLWIFLDPDIELPKNATYKTTLTITAPKSAFEDDDQEQKLIVTKARVHKLFAGCRGLTVHSELVSDDQFSLEDLKRLKKWDYDYLTLKESHGPDQVISP